MGSGKTTQGKKLAQLLLTQFIDLDEAIERSCSKSVSELFTEIGESGFRQIEQRTLQAICNTSPPAVIALGGGTLMEPSNLELVKSKGLLVYLFLPIAAAQARLKQARQQRPLLAAVSDSELEVKLLELFSQREPAYQQAQLSIPAIDLDTKKLYNVILQSGLL